MFCVLLFIALAAAKDYPLTIESCSENPSVVIHKLTVQPDKPINLQGDLIIDFDIEITEPITEGKVEVKFQKEVLFWITVPCTHNVGSCTYDNLCNIMSKVSSACYNATRPKGYNNVPCECPIQPGRFAATIPVKAIDIPDKYEWLADGNYKVHLEITSPAKTIACYDAKFSLAVK